MNRPNKRGLYEAKAKLPDGTKKSFYSRVSYEDAWAKASSFDASAYKGVRTLEDLKARCEVNEGGCWLWTGNTNPYGYGRTSINGKAFDCHRAAWFLAYGPIPKGLYVCHTCDTPQCCNPKHLFIGSQSDNLRDYYAKGRHRRKPASAKIG